MIRIWLIVVTITSMYCLNISRNENGDEIYDFGDGQAVSFCGVLVSKCACQNGETIASENPNLCTSSFDDCALRTFSNGISHPIYFVPFITENQNYIITVKPGSSSINLDVQLPVFIMDLINKMGWNVKWSPELTKRIRKEKKGEEIQVTFNKYWTGLLVKICLGPGDSCVAVKFQGVQSYPLNNVDVLRVIGDEFPPTTPRTTTTTTTTSTSTTTTTTSTTTTTATTTTKTASATTTTTTQLTSTSTLPSPTSTTSPITTIRTTTIAPNTAALGDDSDQETYIIVGVIIAFFFIILIILLVMCYIGRKRKNVAMGKSSSGIVGQHDYVRHLNSEEGLSSSPKELNTRIEKTFYDKINITTEPKVPKSSKKKNSNKEMGITNQTYEDVEGQSTYEIPNEKQNPVFEGPSENSAQFTFEPYYSKNKGKNSPEYATIRRKSENNGVDNELDNERVDMI